ncbi:hypothetical protein BGZ76_001615 [Entomortierella beljakovae]|nr:hypothetical protein BGZ76_001615 [Entomortierella beljakovae]
MVNAFLDSLGLATLEYHWKMLVGSAFVCSLIVQLSQTFSPILFPKTYPKLHGVKRLNWDVSMAHSCIVVALAIPILLDEELKKDRIFGYDFYAGQVYAISCGYFLWDTVHSIRNIKAFGVGFVFHGVCSFSVFILSFRPFLNYYGAVFLMYEISTPFLNINWFMDKLEMTGSTFQLINGVLLLAAFLFVRIIFGIYMSYQTFIYARLVVDQIPWHLIIVYSVANIVLNSLNIFWFQKMVISLSKRFKPSNKSVTKGEVAQIDTKSL